MKYILISLLIFSSVSLVWSQDDYVETEYTIQLPTGKKAKKFKVRILTSEDVEFIVEAKRKVTFQLPVGEIFTLTAEVRGHENSSVKVDLTDVPDDKILAEGPPLVINAKVYRIPGENEEIRYYYSSRYGKMIGQIVSN